MKYYKLVNKIPVECNLLDLAEFLNESGNCKISKTKINDILISTVFLGTDHNFTEKGNPVLFETMVFGGKLDEECVRYCTYDEAIKGHKEMVSRVKRFEITKECK